MLPDPFYDWWFSPWQFATNHNSSLIEKSDELGKRDGYRVWCNEMQVAVDLPQSFDPFWMSALFTDVDSLLATASLFAGLIAAREHNNFLMDGLSFSDRKWCISVATTQPLKWSHQGKDLSTDSIQIRGLIELAIRLKYGFPGMWSRLRLLLPTSMASRIDDEIKSYQIDESIIELSTPRAQRCWRMCRNRVDAMS